MNERGEVVLPQEGGGDDAGLPLGLEPQGEEALRLVLRIAGAYDRMKQAAEELLKLAYAIEGRADSPAAQRAVRQVIAELPQALDALGFPKSATPPHLPPRAAKRVVRLVRG